VAPRAKQVDADIDPNGSQVKNGPFAMHPAYVEGFEVEQVFASDVEQHPTCALAGQTMASSRSTSERTILPLKFAIMVYGSESLILPIDS
jgi:hypothetical protein